MTFTGNTVTAFVDAGTFTSEEVIAAAMFYSRKRDVSGMSTEERLDYVTGEDVRALGNNIQLYGMTASEAQLFVILERAAGVVAKETLYSRVYSASTREPEIKIIDVFVCHIRKKLVKAGAPYRIKTVWGVGYKLEYVPPE